MLTALRKQAGSWVVKALLLLLVMSFAIWGIGDIFYGNPTEETVVSVGSSEITSGELSEAFNRSLSNLQRQFGGQLDREQAVQLGLLQQTMQEQIGQRLLDLEAEELGLTVDDDVIRRQILENPNFQSAGRFDRFRFNQLLLSIGLSEEAYLEVLRRELARNMLTASIVGPASVPDAQVDAIYRFRNEERRGRYIKIADADIETIDAPDEAALETIHKENEARFTAPEYRSLTYVTLEPSDLLDEIDVAEEDIQSAYDQRSAQYVVPERREVQQLLAPDEETAEQAVSLIEEGRAFEAIAEELDGVSFTDLGLVAKDGMPAGIGAEAFEINEGEVTDPAQSPFGFHLFKVAAIEPEQTTPLEEVRDDIRDELALSEAGDRLPDLATALDDELAAGLSVPEAAGALGLEAETVEMVDAQGRDATGAPVAALEGWPGLLQTAFEAFENEPSLLEETDDGAYYVVQVDGITEPRVKELDEVRDEVVALYEERQRREAAVARAEDIRGKLQESASLETIADDADITVQTIEPIKRSANGADAGINAAAVQTLFATDEGAVADQVVETEDGVLVIAADDIIEASSGDDDQAHQQLKAELERQVQAEILDQYGRALQDRHSVQIDEAALARLRDRDPALIPGGAGYPGGQPQPLF